jgi:hypothetical protein
MITLFLNYDNVPAACRGEQHMKEQRTSRNGGGAEADVPHPLDRTYVSVSGQEVMNADDYPSCDIHNPLPAGSPHTVR